MVFTAGRVQQNVRRGAPRQKFQAVLAGGNRRKLTSGFMKKALITGITGQDGSYLAELLLERHGGHPAAGGFTVRAEHLAALHSRLNDLAEQWLNRHGIQVTMIRRRDAKVLKARKVQQ